MERILITGANRGIGLELVRQYVQNGDVRVFAGCRQPDRAAALHELAREHPQQARVIQLDIDDGASIAASVKTVAAESETLDLLINNAGIFPKDAAHQSRELGQLAAADVAGVIATNAVGPLIVTQAYRQLLKKAVNPRVVMVSSSMGSLSTAAGDAYAYRMSKAAMNMAGRSLAQDSAMSGIITIMTHPGWVQTDMGGPKAAITTQESASGLKKLISRLTPASNGRFYLWDGTEHIG